MKQNTLILLMICNLFITPIIAQQLENFYVTKAELDPYYDSLIQVNGIESMQGTGYKHYKRWCNYWEPLLYPHGDFSIQRQKFEQHINNFVSDRSGQSVAPFTLDWEFIGPDKMPEGQQDWANGLGQIHYIAFDPNDATYQKMFACSPAGGLWRSFNGGDSWTNAGTDKGLPQCGVSSIAIDPENSDTHWFISTGNAEGLNRNIWQDAIGVWRTTNAGSNWELIGLDTPTSMRKVILKRYQNKIHLFVTTDYGLYECEDALANDPEFDLLLSGDFYDIEFDPQNTGIVYASGSGANTHVYKVDWINNDYSELPNLSLIPINNKRRLTIEISEAAHDYLFIVAIFENYASLYKYNLLTNTITPKGDLPSPAVEQGIGHERAMGWTITSNLFNNDLIMVYGNVAPIMQSNNLLDNNTCNWTDITTKLGEPSEVQGCSIHNDMHYMLFEPDGLSLWVGNDGGVFKTTFPDPLNNWAEKNNGLAVAMIFNLAISEYNTSLALSGAFDCGALVYTKNNNIWSSVHTKYGDSYQCQFDWNDADRMWLSNQHAIHRSDNGGEHFTPAGSGFHWETFFIQNHTNPQILYGADDNGVRRTTDYGDTWEDYANFPGVETDTTWRIANSLTHENYIYASWVGNIQGSPQKIFKSTTGGGTNTNNWEDVGSPPINAWISSIAVDYYNPDKIWVAAGDKVYNVSTITSQWVDVSSGLPSGINISHLEILPSVSNTLYAGTSYGLYYYTAQSGVWQYVESDLPNIMIKDIQIDLTNKRIAVGTLGRGVWEADLPCITSDETTYITSNQTWELDNNIIGNLSIEPNNTLTILNSTIRLNKDSKIIVKPGAKLVIDGGRLTSSCDEPWQGIEVWGNSTQGQNPLYQGWLVITNGATIENAVTAVLVDKSGTKYELEVYTGGIVHAGYSTFKNNINGVVFNPYTQLTVSQFNSCLFITDEYWPHQNTLPESHITINDYIGLKFDGCSFEGDNIQMATQYRGKGINSTNSDYTVDQICISGSTPCTEYKRSTFTNLYYGIYAQGTNSESSIDVQNSVFDCYRGILNETINNSTFILNSFTVQRSVAGLYEPYGLYLDNSTSYQVEGNTFEGLGNSIDYGLYVNNSGAYDNLIYNNTFNDLYIATAYQDINRNNVTGGLEIKCNDYTNNGSDIVVVIQDGSPGVNHGIAQAQGSNLPNVTAPAGNTFSITNHTFDIYNESNGINYWYHNESTASGIKIKPNINFGPVYTFENSDVDYVKEDACPPTFGGGGGIGDIKGEMLTAKSSADSISTVLLSLIDGGNTNELTFDLATAMPGEEIETRDLLLSESPDLSDTVMIATIEMEEVLPNAMVRDVLTDNPQAAKSKKVQDALDQRNNQMPQYMRNQINEGRDTLSPKELLESEIAYHNMQKTLALKQLHYLYRTDTTIVNSSDSLAQLYLESGSLDNQYRLAMLELSNGDTIQSIGILDNIQSDFELSNVQEDERQSFINYFTIIKNMRRDTIQKPDSITIVSLYTLFENGNGMPVKYVRNMLIAAGEITYNEPLLLPDTTLKTSITDNASLIEQEQISSSNFLLLKPNPANNYVIAEWKLPDTAKDSYLHINDINGYFIEKIKIRGRQNEMVISISNWKPGTYFVSLVTDGLKYENRKLTIVK